jgi:hypothetical protein
MKSRKTFYAAECGSWKKLFIDLKGNSLKIRRKNFSGCFRCVRSLFVGREVSSFPLNRGCVGGRGYLSYFHENEIKSENRKPLKHRLGKIEIFDMSPTIAQQSTSLKGNSSFSGCDFSFHKDYWKMR